MSRSDSQEVIPGGAPLIERIRQEAARVPGASRIRLALGYLFVPGLAPVWEALETSAATEIQLLIGNTAGVLTDEQRIAAAESAHSAASGPTRLAPELDMAAGARAERSRIIDETARALRENLGRLPGQTAENRRFLLGLAGAIGASRVRVRIYPDGRLHAKASLFDRVASGESTALVGSSNLTLPATGNPTELNVLVHDPAAVGAVGDWFDSLWDVSQDFTRALFVEVSARAAGE